MEYEVVKRCPNCGSMPSINSIKLKNDWYKVFLFCLNEGCNQEVSATYNPEKELFIDVEQALIKLWNIF